MRKLMWIIPLIGFLGCSDDDGVSGTRYVDDIFSDVSTTLDIKYGENAALVGITQDLYLDVYEPSGDQEVNRPLLILAHGGAFVSGTKTQIKDLCNAYALKGYVVASIGYRLINDPSISDSVAYSEGVVLALGDLKAAIRYMRNDALNGISESFSSRYPTFIDMTPPADTPPMIIILGSTLNVGYLDENDSEIPEYLLNHLNTHGGFEGDSNEINVSSEVQGILSFSGSVFRDAWIDSNDPPIFMVHDEFDPVVPCEYEDTNVVPFPILAYGSCSILDALEEADISSELVIIEGSDGHVSYLGEDQGQEIIDKSAQFISQEILN
ncbi:MAG: alpha/beta hydrolase [Bacteroidota bacterium]